MSKRKLLREQKSRMAEASADLRAVRDGIDRAYNVFNNTSDPALLETSILEMHALERKYSCLLRNIKLIEGETNYASVSNRRRIAGHSLWSYRTAAEASEKAYEMGS